MLNIKSGDDINQTSLVTFCSLLDVSKSLDLFSNLLTITALGFAIASHWWAYHLLLTLILFAVFISGLIEKYYALRIYFDKKLFRYLASRIDQLPQTLIELDNELINLKLIKSNDVPVRSITARKLGTLRLLKKQIISHSVQILLLIVILFV